MERRRALGQRGLDADQRRSTSQVIGRAASAMPSTASRVPTRARIGLAAVAHEARREDRLVLDGREDAEGIGAGNVRGREDRLEAGMGGLHRREVAEGEAGAGMGRAHGAHPQRTLGRMVGAEAIGALHLRQSVGAGDAGADRAARFRHRRIGIGAARHGVDGLDDLGVAGAAAEHAADAVLDLRARGGGVARQQVRGGHDHAGGADAALGRALGEEGGAQPVDQRIGGLDRGDGRPSACAGGDEAGADLRAIEKDGAGAAIAGIAADLGAGEPQALAQRVGEARKGRGGDLRASPLTVSVTVDAAGRSSIRRPSGRRGRQGRQARRAPA